MEKNLSQEQLQQLAKCINLKTCNDMEANNGILVIQEYDNIDGDIIAAFNAALLGAII